MKLTPHFSLAELTASNTAKARGIDNTPAPEHLDKLTLTAELLERVRTLLGLAIWVDARAEVAGIKTAIVELVQVDIKTAARIEANAALIRRLVEDGK